MATKNYDDLYLRTEVSMILESIEDAFLAANAAFGDGPAWQMEGRGGDRPRFHLQHTNRNLQAIALGEYPGASVAP